MTVLALPEGPRGRLLAGVLLLVVAIVLWVALIAPPLDFYRQRAAELTERRAAAARMIMLATTLPRLRAAAGAENQHRGSVSSHLAGATDALAAAALETIVGQIAATHGLEISSVDTPPAQNTVWGRRIGVVIRASGSYRAVVAFIAQIEMAQPKMVVDDLEIHSQGGGDVTIDQPLDSEMTIYGFRTPGGGS